MKYNILFFLVLCFTVVNGCDNTSNINITDNFVCRCFLFNTSCNNYNYLIEVDKQGVLTTFTGSENTHLYDNISTNVNITASRNPFLEEVITRDSVMLLPKELDELKNSLAHLRNETCTNPFLNSVFYDKWVAVLLLGNKQYVFNIMDKDSYKMKLVNYLIRLSKKKIRLLPYKEIPQQTYPYRDSIPLFHEAR